MSFLRKRFRIRFRPEQALQKTVAEYLNIRYPGALWTASASGTGRIGVIAGSMLKMMGYRKGCPDILIFEPRGKYHGLHLELKTAGLIYLDGDKTVTKPGGKAIPEQADWIEQANARGYLAVVCTGIDETITVIDDYFRSGKG